MTNSVLRISKLPKLSFLGRNSKKNRQTDDSASSDFINLGNTFIKNVGVTPENLYLVPLVQAMPKIMEKYLNRRPKYILVIQMRSLVLQYMLDTGFAQELEDKFKFVCYKLLEETCNNITGILGNLKKRVKEYCRENNTTPEDLLGTMLTSPQVLHLHSNKKLTLGELLKAQPELFLAISMTPSKK